MLTVHLSQIAHPFTLPTVAACQQIQDLQPTANNKVNCFDFSCTQLPVRGPGLAAQQSQVLQQWKLWLHPKAHLHV